MKRLLICCLFSIPLLGGPYKALDKIPSTQEAIINYSDSAKTEFQSQLEKFKSIPSSKRTFENTVLSWNQMMETLWTKTVELAFLSKAVEDPAALNRAQKELIFLIAKLQGASRDKENLQIFIDFANSPQGAKLSPPEAYELSQLLATGDFAWEKKNMLPYQELKGKAKPINNKTITVLNWNVCFFPSNLSLFFGGVLPWPERIENVAKMILSNKPNLVCLQEVFSKEAALKLYELLKDNYAYFYIHIGVKPFGFNPDLFGMSSGLFIASNYKLENPTYVPFNDTSRSHGYGFFVANIDTLTIISTHLTPGTETTDQSIRSAQMNQILKFADDHLASNHIFLCGDLNIESKSPEYNKIVFPNFDDYSNNLGWTCLELSDFWWKARQNVKVFNSLKIPKETIDYVLKIKGPALVLDVSTKLIQANNPKAPQDALSDHQALFSTIKQNF